MDQITNKQFSNLLRDRRARFALCDLHTHSPASFDVLSGYWEQLHKQPQDALKNLKPPNREDVEAVLQYQDEVLESYPPDLFIQDILAQRDNVSTELNLSSSDDWAIAAITDHNVCKYSCLCAQTAWKKRGENRLVLLPAIELDVRFPVPGGEESVAHILCMFPVHTQPDDIAHAITSAGNGRQWKEGQPVYYVDDLSQFVTKLRSNSHQAICIAAHVSSSKGVQKECKKAIKLTGREAAISQLQSMFDSAKAEYGPESTETNKAEEDLESAKKDYSEEAQLATLKLIGSCGFDSLQVGSPDDYRHYRRLHRHTQSKGRATLIVCSDAHSTSAMFRTGNYIPHLKVNRVLANTDPAEAFNIIRHSLRLAETRFTARPFTRSESWIEGALIRTDAEEAHAFFRKPEDGIIGLSRNLTCIVGGRGSGKSALLDAIGFVARPNDFSTSQFTSQKPNALPDYATRSEQLFSGHEIRLCWRFARTELPAEFRKGAFASRYFSNVVKSEPPSQTDFSGKSADSVPLPPVSIYRFQELEQYATGTALRKFLDAVYSSDLDLIAAELEGTKTELERNRTELIETAKKIIGITSEGAALRVYAENLHLFRQVDDSVMRTQLQGLDDAKAAEIILGRAKDRFVNLKEKLTETGLESRLDSITYLDLSRDLSVGTKTDELAALERELASVESDNTTINQIRTSANALDQALNRAVERIEQLRADGAERHRVAHDKLAQQGMPTGVDERNARRKRLQDSKTQLEQYREHWKHFEKLKKRRNELFENLEQACARRTEVRHGTCEEINGQLNENLDASVLKILADAGDGADNGALIKWMDASFEPVLRTHRDRRVREIAKMGIMPRHVRDALFSRSYEKALEFIVDTDRVDEGRVTEADINKWLQERAPFQILDPESRIAEFEKTDSGLPTEIRNGLHTFAGEDEQQAITILDQALRLEEIEYDDQPAVFMNDRPGDPESSLRPIDEMSPGQRCSALLPILILNGTGPLVIDQPEDNLDNRLIREVIVNVLSTMKLRRQIIIATHNPNLPVLGDAEQVIALAATGDKDAQLFVHGDLDEPHVVKAITDIMEGGREAFQYRYAVYGAHWGDSAVVGT